MTEKRHLKIAPSILTSDFTRLGETIDMLNSSQTYPSAFRLSAT